MKSESYKPPHKTPIEPETFEISYLNAMHTYTTIFLLSLHEKQYNSSLNVSPTHLNNYMCRMFANDWQVSKPNLNYDFASFKFTSFDPKTNTRSNLQCPITCVTS